MNGHAARVEVGPEVLEQELRRDLTTLSERMTKDSFSYELYRALTNNDWTKEGFPGRVALSWRRAEELVNELREERGGEPLQLHQTGNEGEVSDDVAAELGWLGWRRRPLDTSRHDPAHLEREGEPARGAEPPQWEREAHEEADREIRRRVEP